MNPLEMHVLVAMRHEELHRLRDAGGRRLHQSDHRPLGPVVDPIPGDGVVRGRLAVATVPADPYSACC